MTPDFQIGCKRILISNDYYPALDRDHVDLVTDGIREITPTGIVTADGTEPRGRRHRSWPPASTRPSSRSPHHIKGRDGRTLADAWRETRDGGVQGHHDRRLPQPVPDRRPQHRPGPLVDGVHHREPDRLHPLRARSRWASAGIAAVEPTPEARRTPGTTTCSAGCSAPCGAPAAARAGTSTRTAATPRCGRAPRSSSASCCAASTSTSTSSRRVDDADHRRSTPHEDPRQQGRRDHRRRLRHRSRDGARSPPAQGALLAVSDWNEQGSPRPSTCSRPPVRASCAATSSTSPTAPRWRRWAAAVAEQFGRVNMVVNNAGVTVTGDFEEMSYEDFDWIVGVNFMGVVNGTKEFLPHLIASGDGAPGQHLQPVRADQHARPDGVQRHQVRRPRLHRGAARGDADQRPPGDASPACTPAASRPASPATAARPPSQDARAIDRLFEKKLARMTAEKAAQIIIKGALAGKARVLVGIDAHAHAPLRQAHRLALPGHRRPGARRRRCPPASRPSTADRPSLRAGVIRGPGTGWAAMTVPSSGRRSACGCAAGARGPARLRRAAHRPAHLRARTREHADAEQQCRERLASYLLDWEEFGFGYLAVEELAQRPTGRLGRRPADRRAEDAEPLLPARPRRARPAATAASSRRRSSPAAREELPDHTVAGERSSGTTAPRWPPRRAPASWRWARSADPEDGPDDPPSVVLELRPASSRGFRDLPGRRCRRRRRRRPARRRAGT